MTTMVDLVVGAGIPNGCTVGPSGSTLPYEMSINPPPAGTVWPGLNRAVRADTWDWFRSQTTPALLAQFTEVARYSA
jgi:hypothetical protein